MNKKLPLLTLFTVNDDYIKFLYKHDSEILFNKSSDNSGRKYMGVILNINEHKYYAPLSSQNDLKNKLDKRLFFAIGQNLGILRFDKMIPVDTPLITKFNLSTTDSNYKNLVKKQFMFINRQPALIEINKKATKIYNDFKKKILPHYSNYHPNFSLLEQKSIEYKNMLKHDTTKKTSVKQRISGRSKKIKF